MSYKLDPNDVRVIEKDKRVKKVIQRKDGIVELHTNNITMYLRGFRNYNRADSYAVTSDLGEVKVEIDLNKNHSSITSYGSIPFRVINPKPKNRLDRYDPASRTILKQRYPKASCIDHPMYGPRSEQIATKACLGDFFIPFREAFKEKDIITITTLLLESMQFVYNHDSSLWNWVSS